MEPIHSIDNPGVRQLGRLLSESKERKARGLAVAEGPHLLAEAIKAGLLRELWATPEALASREAPELLRAAKAAKPKLISANLVKRLSQLPAPQGWLAVVETRSPDVESKPSLSLALDGVQDPGNMGTLLRSAWAADASLILGPGCADPWSPKVLRSGAGAQFQVRWQSVEDLGARLKQLRDDGVQVLAAAPRAKASFRTFDMTQPTCLVLGAEGPGLSQAALLAAGSTVTVPYPGAAESLNVAVTGSVLLFEALRQREKGV